MRLAGTVLVAVVAVLVVSSRANSAEPERPVPVALSGPQRVRLYDTLELDIQWNEQFVPCARVPERLLFDAFDADNDGRFIRVDAIFRHEGGDEIVVPAFAMKVRREGPWLWKVRFGPRKPGKWSCSLQVACGLSDGPASELSTKDGDAWRCDFRTDRAEYRARFGGGVWQFECVEAENAVGPIVKPAQGENPNYFWRLGPDQRREWLFGYAVTRPWVVPDNPDGSFPDEWIDRERELLKPMREHGANILYQWMAPWELLLVHRKRSEHWPVADHEGNQIDGHFDEYPLPPEVDWSGYAYYDQGRAAAMDRILRQLEGDNENEPTIYLMLAPLPHTCFQMALHPWSGLESGWSVEDDWGFNQPQKINGFSGFRKSASAYEFFQASPEIEDRTDWRRQWWDWQASFFRYVIARWGATRSLAAWVLMDELDAVGSELGSQLNRRGWWAHPECSKWHDAALRFFRGELSYRRDGQLVPYSGDPYEHLITSSAMEYNYRLGIEDNGTWLGGDEKVDFATYHSYPVHISMGKWQKQDDEMKFLPLDQTLYAYGVYATSYGSPSYIPYGSATWRVAAERLRDWAIAVGQGRPRMITESGYIERFYATDSANIYGAKYPTVFHYQVWAALMSGHASTPINWCDGKEFGEMRWRERRGSFARGQYPINLYLELSSARALLGDVRLPELTPAWAQDRIEVDMVTADGVRLSSNKGDCWAMVSPRTVIGWAFVVEKPTEELSVRVRGLEMHRAYQARFFNTWTGQYLAEPVALKGSAKEAEAADAAAPHELLFPITDAFRACTGRRTEEVQDDQKDIAFVIQQIEKP